MRPLFASVLFVVGIAVGGSPVSAQNPLQTSRAFMAEPGVLARGDAGVALAQPATGFFYNPAHLARLPADRSYRRFAGVSGTVSSRVFDQVDFYRDRLEPAIDQGIDQLPDDSLDALYAEAFELGRQRAFADGQLLLPAVAMRMGPVAIGGGLFAQSDVSYRVRNAGLDVPLIDAVGRTDAIAIASGAADLGAIGLSGLAAGVNLKATRRYLTVKNKPLDAFREDEDVLVFKGTSVGVDLGVLYGVSDLPIPGALNFGLAIYDWAASDFGYSLHGTVADVPVAGWFVDVQDASPDADLVDREAALIRDRYTLARSYRMGVAYQLSRWSGLEDIGVALDYIGYKEPTVEQSTLAHVHAGVEASVLGWLVLRGGISQGYTTAGVGLHFGMVRVDYAFHGVEDGRRPGQITNEQHSVQIAIGHF